VGRRKLFDFIDAWERHHMKRGTAKVRKFLESLPVADWPGAWV
jgi:hypothetical protein